MDELFSCRNCIQNCAQTLNIGNGAGFCIRHNSVIHKPNSTTCKYLHRKDLPKFAVDEGVREHAAEFAMFSGMVDLFTHEPIRPTFYSEKFSWEKQSFDPLINVLAQYHKSEPAWVFVESFTSGMDGRRAIAHSCLIRRYMDNCDTWKSSYRLVMASIYEMDDEPHFSKRDLRTDIATWEVHSQAIWDLVFVRFSLIQEYGWHAGIEDLIWITDSASEQLINFDWDGLRERLSELKPTMIEKIIKHARDNGAFFSQPENTQGASEYIRPEY